MRAPAAAGMAALDTGELEVHIAEAEASVAVLKALLADDAPGEEDPR